MQKTTDGKTSSTVKRAGLLAALLGLGWLGWAFLAAVMAITVAAALGAFAAYVNAKAAETTAEIGSITNALPADPRKPKQQKFILHHRYDVGEPDSRGQVEMALTPGAAASFGQWRIDRSTNLTDWTPSASLYTDQESADLLARILFATETNLSGRADRKLFYRARKEGQP